MGYYGTEAEALEARDRFASRPRLPNVGELAGYSNAPVYMVEPYETPLERRLRERRERKEREGAGNGD